RHPQPAGAGGRRAGAGALPLRGVGAGHRRPGLGGAAGFGGRRAVNSPALAGVLLGYLVFLFLVAAVAERFGRRLAAPRLRSATWVLAISVYCTAWTFYGSVGLAANRGLEFLTIYLGPALVALLWPTVVRKLIRVVKEQRITTISDLVASRYGKSAGLGT